MHIHHLTLLVIFLPQSWYGRGRQMPTTWHSSLRPFCSPRISTSNFDIFKDLINIFLIALSIDNQWTVKWHTWLPYKTNQFHVQHDFLFLSKRPVCGQNVFQRSQILNIVEVLSKKNILIDIKTKKCTPKSVLRWEFASVYISTILNELNQAMPRSCYLIIHKCSF